MDIAAYLKLARNWLWLILLTAFIAGGVSFVIRSRQAEQYEAQVIISIGSFIQSPNPDATEIRTGVELAQTYAELIKTYDVLQGTIDTLNLPIDAVDLRGLIRTSLVPDTSLLQIRVTYPDPLTAADIANELTQQLILNSPTNLTPAQQSQIDLANDQINRLTRQLESSSQQLELVESRLEGVTDPEEIQRLSEQRDTFIDQINQASATVAQFSNTITSLQQRTNSVDVVERARVPTQPSGTSVLVITLLGGIMGAVLGFGGAVLIEYFNDTIRTSAEISEALTLPILGIVPRYGGKNDRYQQRLITGSNTETVIESYRTLRTNLMFSTDAEEQKVYIVTSPGPEEGKSVTSANLAVAMALAGQKVLIIDADLRRPRVHQFFGLPNEIGLTNLLTMNPRNLNHLKPQEDGTTELERVLRQSFHNTGVDRLRALTSGAIPGNPAELLGSGLMQHWIQTFRNVSRIDVILIDTPPCLLVSDSVTLAAAINAGVILVIRAGHTRRSDAIKARDRFTQVGANIKGVVLNQVSPKDQEYYGYGYYYSDQVQP